MVQKLQCPTCNDSNVVKRGTYETENRGAIQRYYCKTCNHKFVPRSAFFRMRNNPHKITASLDLFFMGASTRKVQAHLGAFYPHNATNVTVYRWVRRFASLINNFTENVALQNTQEVELDEMQCNRRGFENWFIDAVDPVTRYVVVGNFAETRSYDALSNAVRHIRKNTKHTLRTITTDGLMVYPKAISKHFPLTTKYQKKLCGITHTIRSASNGEGFNLAIERVHNSLRQRTVLFRGFHGSMQSADILMKGLVIYYNFIRNHEGINTTPSELATSIKLTSRNKWLELIELSYNHS